MSRCALCLMTVLMAALIVNSSLAEDGLTGTSLVNLEALAEKALDLGNANIEQTAVTIAKDYPGEYNINQVSAIFDTLIKGWYPISDPNYKDKWKNANLTLRDGHISESAGMGDCDDFAILMASLIASLGGSARITIAANATSTEGHAYCELFLGKENDPQVNDIINWIKAQYSLTEVLGLDRTGDEVWLNLDWWDKNLGGRYLEGDIGKVVWQSPKLVSPKIVPIIDSMDTTAGWDVVKDNLGSNAIISLAPARKGRGLAINITYDLKEGGWAGISKDVDPELFHLINGLNFSYSGMSKQNTLELRLVDDNGTEFVTSWKQAANAEKWQYLQALFDNFECMDSNEKCFADNLSDKSKVKKLEIIVSNRQKEGDAAGHGKVEIDHIVGVMNVPPGSPWARAEEQRREVQSLQLVSQSEDLLKKDSGIELIQAIQLAVESLNCHDSVAGESALRSGLSRLARPILRLSHDASISSIAISPNGMALATASEDNTIRIWDLRTGLELHNMTHDGTINTIAFSSDSKKLITSSHDNTSRIWDAETGSELRSLNHDDAVLYALFSQDNKKIATASENGIVKIYDAKTGSELHRLNQHAAVCFLAFSPDGTILAAGSEDKTVVLWDVAKGQKNHQMLHDIPENEVVIFLGESDIRASRSPIAFSFSLDGKILTSIWDDDIIRDDYNNSILIVDVKTGQLLNNLRINSSTDSIAFSPDGKILAAALFYGNYYSILFWDTKTATLLNSLHSSRPDIIDFIAFSPDGRTLALHEFYRNTIKILDFETKKEIRYIKLSDAPKNIAFSPDGKILVSTTGSIAEIWDIQTGSELHCMNHGNQSYVMRNLLVAFRPDGKMLASGGYNGTVIWDSRTGKELHCIPIHGIPKTMFFSSDNRTLITASHNKLYFLDAETGHEFYVGCNFDSNDTDIWDVDSIAFSKDGKKLATSNQNTFQVWDISSRKVLSTFVHNESKGASIRNDNVASNRVALSPDGTYLAAINSDGTIEIWDVEKSQKLWLIDQDHFDNAISFSPDGTQIATACADGNTRIIDVLTGRELAKMKSNYAVNYVVFSSNGSQIATATSDYVSIWDIQTKNEIHRIYHDKMVDGISFSPDGKQLATITEDGIARIWQVSAEDLICQACGRLGNGMTSDDWMAQYCCKCNESMFISAL